MGTDGDAFFVAFDRARDAVNAAVDGQHALESHRWHSQEPLRVRMGLHTGEALVRGGDYVGHEVHRAKRISDAGHGGQILLSQTTADLVGNAVSLTDLGPHRLKDLAEAQRIYQVGDDEFPPLRSLEAFRHTLPAQRSSFIGREREIADVTALLERGRLVTLTGIGGGGKTRLALQVGAELLDSYRDGVFFADLAPVSDSAVLPQTLAAAVGMSLGGLGEASPEPVTERLLNYLAKRHCLVTLDNCEHLLDGCAELVDSVLVRCPEVTVLATSREALEIEGEQTWRVPSLSIPEGAAEIAAAESVTLFKARAQAADPSFELTADNVGAVAEICRRLDGIPLAIEFAAARVAHLSARQIADRLDDMFRLLAGGRRRVQRQQTLHAALDWSHELLAEDERALLRRLAVFAGGFGLGAVEAVCAGEGLERTRVIDLLGSLVSKSLVATETGAKETRYRLLEAVRLYAEEKLRERGEAEGFRTRHRDHYLAWVESMRPGLDRLSEVTTELGNLRAALRWSLAEGRRDLVGRLAGRLGMLGLWSGGGLDQEGYEWLREALEDPAALERPVLVDCLAAQSTSAMTLTDPESLPLAQRAIDAAQGEPSPGLAWALTLAATNLGVLAGVSSSPDLAAQSRRLSDQGLAVAREIGAAEGIGLIFRGQIEFGLGDYLAAGRFFGRAADPMLAPEGGVTRPMALGQLAVARHLAGDDAGALEAASLGFEAMKGAPSAYRGPMAGASLAGFAVALAASGDHLRAAAMAGEYLELARSSGTPLAVNEALIVCAILAFRRDEADRASRLLAAGRHAGGASGMQGVQFRTPMGWALYRHYIGLIREALGAEKARRIRDEAKSMSVEDAVDYALQGLDVDG